MPPTDRQFSPYRESLTSLRGGFQAAAGLSAVISLLMLTGSVYMLQVYDRVLASGSVATLLALFSIVVVLHGFLAVYDSLRMRLLSRLSLRLDAQMAARLFTADLEQRQEGSVTGTLVSDMDQLRAVIAGPAMLALFDLPFTLLFLGILFLIHPLLGWLTLLGMGLAALLALANRMVLSGTTAKALEAEHVQRRFAEGVRQSAPSLAALGMTHAVTSRWLGFHQRKLQHQQQGFEPSEVLSALSRSLRMLLQSGLLTAAAWLVLGGAITAGAIVAASILSGRALAPVDQLIGQWRNISAARDAHRRLSAAPLAPRDTVLDLPPLTGALEVRNLVRLGGTGGDGTQSPRVLDDVSFSLAAGESLGIIGTSASGKSTLARLIVGAIRADGGEIRFDGATALQWDADQLGRQIGYLPQRIDLLPGTVRDNIARFDPAATDDSVIRAAMAAGVHEMILRLPDGYNTELGGRDIPLSGGQIQRIGLARALFGDPKILVLDEPNAHLDMAGEAALVRNLNDRRAAGVTVIILAHRAGALAAVDRLIVLQDGKITQDGPRDNVLDLLGARPPATAAPAPATVSNVMIRSLASDNGRAEDGDLAAFSKLGDASALPPPPPLLFRHTPRRRMS